MMTILRALACALPLLALGACTTVLLPPNVAPVAPKANSLVEAERMLLEASRERAAAEARYAAAEQVCYQRFFVNDCLDQAKEERRVRLAFLKALQNEAEYFQRKAAVEERDRKLAQAEKQFQEEQAKFAAEPPAPPKIDEPLPPPRGKLEQRNAERAARQARQAEKDRRKAAEAPARVAAYEKMVAESQERQRRVAERQAENARKKAEREAAEKKAAEERAAAKAQQQK